MIVAKVDDEDFVILNIHIDKCSDIYKFTNSGSKNLKKSANELFFSLSNK